MPLKMLSMTAITSLIDCNAGTIKEIAEKFHNIIITNNEETIWSKQYVNKDLNADNCS